MTVKEFSKKKFRVKETVLLQSLNPGKINPKVWLVKNGLFICAKFDFRKLIKSHAPLEHPATF